MLTFAAIAIVVVAVARFVIFPLVMSGAGVEADGGVWVFEKHGQGYGKDIRVWTVRQGRSGGTSSLVNTQPHPGLVCRSAERHGSRLGLQAGREPRGSWLARRSA